jgi:hypothetical protein
MVGFSEARLCNYGISMVDVLVRAAACFLEAARQTRQQNQYVVVCLGIQWSAFKRESRSPGPQFIREHLLGVCLHDGAPTCSVHENVGHIADASHHQQLI